MNLSESLEMLLSGAVFSRAEASEFIGLILQPDAEPLQISAALAVIRQRGATGQELAGFAEGVLADSRMIQFEAEGVVDTCGTGGGPATINISTAAALMAAAAGAKTAKHGGRSVTSQCGSADVLMALGIELTNDEGRLQQCMNEAGFAFLFAPDFHPAMKVLGPMRRQMGFRTVFNQLGPLMNPAKVKRQIIGVYHSSFLEPMAEAARLLGAHKTLIVHGADAMDEISPCGPSEGLWTDGTRTELRPEQFGFAPLVLSTIKQGTLAENAEAVVTGLTNRTSIEFYASLPAAATAVSLSLDIDIAEAVSRIESAVDSGAGLTVLQKLREITTA